jgi:hypothetical protein
LLDKLQENFAANYVFDESPIEAPGALRTGSNSASRGIREPR